MATDPLAHPADASPPLPRHLPELDGLRGVAAVIVIVFHSRVFFQLTGNVWAGLPAIGWITAQGWMLVDLFFVLSGFILAHVYRLGERIDGAGALRRFGWARFARLWPLHAAMLVLAVVVNFDLDSTNWRNALLSISMLHVAIGESALNDPAWSLSVECICYGLFAVSAFIGPRTLAGVAVIAVLGGFALTFDPAGIECGRGLLGFFWGQTIYRARGPLGRLPTILPVLAAASWPLAAGSKLFLPYTTLFVWPAILILALRTPALASRPMQWLGDRSYSLYLCHMPIFLAWGDTVAGLGLQAVLGNWGVLLAAGLIVGLAANSLYIRLERPAQRWLLEAVRRRRAVRQLATVSV